MDIDKVFHMKGGIGDTSYPKNSSLQKLVADKVKHITVETMEKTYLATTPKSLGIADLGCSSGPNTLSNIKQLVDAVEKACQQLSTKQPAPEFRVYLNDLPTNDFNTLFQAFSDFKRDLNTPSNIYIAGYPGTFYGRLFPDDCLHFVYSSNSLHWLSRVPPGLYDEKGESINKTSIYITKMSPEKVSQAYLKQFQDDFSLFLKSRSRELIGGGRMVLIFLGRRGPSHMDPSNSSLWEILYQSFATLVTQGEIEEEKLFSYEVHFYAPSKEELEDEIRKEGSFKVEQIEMFEMEEKEYGKDYGTAVARAVRSVQESMIAHHFGLENAIMDKLFHIYGTLIDQELTKHDIKSIHTLLHLTKSL